MNFKAITFAAGIFISVLASGQNLHVKRGPRPSVNIDALPETAFRPGELYIKFKSGFDSVLKSNITKNKSGNFHVGINAIDALTRLLGVTKLERSFEKVLQTGNDDKQHQAWGFHRWYSIQLPRHVSVKDAIKKFQALSSIIEIAEPSYNRILYDNTDPIPSWTPADSAYSSQWNFNHTEQQGITSPPGSDADIDLPEAWELEKGKPNVIVAVIDGGADTMHPDLQPNLWVGSGGAHFGYNWNSGSPKLEPNSHATHVCGTIAAVNNNGTGVSGIAGGDGTPGSGVRIMSMQIFNANGIYAGDQGTANAFIYSADHGAAIAQNSWGGGLFSNILTDAIDYFIMNGGGSVLNGGLVVFSAGNNGNDVESFPGNYPPVVCVASTNYDDKKSWYSVYGSWVDIAAPGGETTTGGTLVNDGRKGILSTLPKSTGASYGWLQGTSMACPHVSGVAALCVSKVPGLLSNERLRSILLNTTDDIYPLNPDYIGKLGSGRVNAFKAVQAAAAMTGTVIDSVKNVTVIQSCGEAKLSWVINNANNPVIIAASDTLLFGTPSGSLSPGDVLPGGGKIIYKGNGTNITDQLAVNKRRYYRIWSFSGASYSFHQTVSIIYSVKISPATVSDATGCDLNISWTDILNCNTDSILLLANNKIPFGTPSGTMMLGDTVAGGAKVIYKGRGQGFNYTTDLDSIINIQKWNFNASHEYTNPNVDVYEFASKPNSISSLIAVGASNSTININWNSNPDEQCFAGDDYMVAYSTNNTFGNPARSYVTGEKIQGGGTVLYIGKNTSFQHSSLIENSAYCYKVWKIRNGSEYSFGKAVCSRTLCDNSTILLPFSESFDGEDLSQPDICHWDMNNYTSREDPINIVTGTSNPAVDPLKGSGMIRFNAYNIPAGESARLFSSAVKKGVGKSIDVLFRWYQDSSDYASIKYEGEGITVQWSPDKIYWKAIEFYPRVPVQGQVGWSYKQVTLPQEAMLKDTIYLSFLFTSMFGNNCYLDDLKLKNSSYKPSNGITQGAACESTDSLTMWTNYYDSSGNRLLSIKKNNQDIGKAGQAGFSLKVGGSSEASIIPAGFNYVSNPGGWICMNRYYAIRPVTEPVQKMNVRFYYFTADFDALANKALSFTPNQLQLAHTDLYGWKINDIKTAYNLNPLQGHTGIPLAANYYSDGFSQYVNAPSPDTTTWKYTNMGNNLHSMEYTVRHLGGGGLGIGSTNGRGALQLVTYTFTGNGNWSVATNWANNIVPPATLPSNARIIINPSGTGECILNTHQTIPAGAEILVNPGKKFRIANNLELIKK